MKSLGLVFIALIIIASLLSLSSCVCIEVLEGEQGPPGPITALFVEPDSVSDGDSWNVYGVGFPASTTVTLKFKYLNDNEWVDWYDDTATIDENGYFFSEQDEEIVEGMYVICETYVELVFHGAAQFDCYAIDTEKIAEKATVQTAVIAMMTQNEISSIPNPINYAGGVAYKNMKAFPDNTSQCTVDKVYDPTDMAYTANDKDGYILFGHDDTADDSSSTDLVNYVATDTTTYYYTCEADGTVRQWSDTMMTYEYTD